jgi:hypothetical protein
MEYVLLKQGWCVYGMISVESMSLKIMIEILNFLSYGIGVFGISVETYRKIVIYWDLIGFNGIYPLVNVNSLRTGKSPCY